MIIRNTYDWHGLSRRSWHLAQFTTVSSDPFPDAGVSPLPRRCSSLMRYMSTHALEAKMEVRACNEKAPVRAGGSFLPNARPSRGFGSAIVTKRGKHVIAQVRTRAVVRIATVTVGMLSRSEDVALARAARWDDFICSDKLTFVNQPSRSTL